MQSYNPAIAVTTAVWAVPVSLATTKGITIVLFSSRYLDVSVPWVVFLSYDKIPCLQHGGLTHSEICGLIHIC
jgi:hypothetical protein